MGLELGVECWKDRSKIGILLIRLGPWFFFWLGIRTIRASELEFLFCACSGLEVREYCTPYNVCEGLARVIVYVGLGPMISLIKLMIICLWYAWSWIVICIDMLLCMNGLDRWNSPWGVCRVGPSWLNNHQMVGDWGMHGTLLSTHSPIERLYDTGWAWVYGWAMRMFD